MSVHHEILGGAIVLFLLVCLIPVVWKRGIRDPFEGRPAFVFFFALSTLPYPILIYLGQVPARLPSFDDALVLRALMLSLLGLVSFYVGYELSAGERLARAIPTVPPEEPVKILRAAVFVLAVSAVLFGAFVAVVGGPAAYLRAGYLGLYRLELGREYFAIGLPLLGTGVLLLYHAACETRSRAVTVLYWITFLSLGALLFAIGRRRYLLTLILAMVVYRHYRKHRLSLQVLAGYGGAGFILFNLWGILRRFSLYEVFTRNAWREVLQLPFRDFFASVATEGEFSGAGVWLPQIITQLGTGELTYLHGLSYLKAPVTFIPRILFPGRPPVLSEWYVATFHPELAAQGGGMGFFFLGEAYLNFGLLGIVGVMFLAGVVFRCATVYVRRHLDSGGAVLLYAAIISWIPSGIRVDFATAFKGFTEFFFAILLLAVLYSGGWRARERVPEGIHG